jgi:LemA protein
MPTPTILMITAINANSLIAGLIVGLLVIALIAFIIGLYNRIVLLKNNVAKAYANIDVLLMQRADEVPNLVAIVKASSEHEKTVLNDLTSIRANFLSSKDSNKRVNLSNQMNILWRNTVAVIESYPDLKVGNAFLALQKRMTELENHIADRREFFNESVTLYNTGIRQFPAIIMAIMFGYREKNMLQHDKQGNP